MGIEGLEGLDGLVRATGLHVARVMGVLWFLPIFAQGSAARFQKIGLSMVIGILVATARTEHLEDPGSDPLLLALATMRELLFGLVFGWMASLVFEAARIAGALIATEMGLNMSNQVDPISGLSQPLLSQLFISLVAILFFMSGGHELVIASLVHSFETVKPGTFMLGPEMFKKLRETRGNEHDGLILPDKLAETYFHVAQQHRSTWTHEIDLRSFSDRPWWNH